MSVSYNYIGGVWKLAFKKSGQITVYIIVGLVLLIIASITFYYVSRPSFSRLEPTLTELPSAFLPVRSYVESCLVKVSKDNLNKVGMHGGYINPTEYGLSYYGNPTEGDAIAFPSKNNELTIPYWHYLKSNNKCADCVLSTKRPNLLISEGEPSIEGQLNKHIESDLSDCLNNFEDLKAMGYTFGKIDKPILTTSINEDSVSFYLILPVEVTFQGSTMEVRDYFSKVEVKLKKMYEMAYDIYYLQQSFGFMENYMLDNIAGLSGVKKDIPPFDATTMGFDDIKFWDYYEVRKVIKDYLLPAYIPRLQVEGALGYEREVVEPAAYSRTFQRIRDNSIIPVKEVLGNSYSDISADFLYSPDWWDIYFDVSNNNGVIGPESVKIPLPGFIDFLAPRRYSTLYDISFPFVVMLSDPSAFNEEGFVFQFAMEANIRGNDALKKNNTPIYNPTSGPASLFCDIQQRDSKNFTFTIIDDYTQKPLSDIIVTYNAGETCFMGKTDENGKLTVQFPSSIGGLVSFKNYYYLVQSIPIDLEGQSNYTIYLKPIIAKNISVSKLLVSKNGDSWGSASLTSLSNTEHAIVSIRRISDITYDDYIATAIYAPDPKLLDLEEGTTLRLAEGDYEVNIISFGYSNYSLTDTNCSSSFSGEGTENSCPALNLNLNVGSTVLDKETGYFSVTKGDLTSKNQIEFVVLSYDLSKNADTNDLEYLYPSKESILFYIDQLRPTFK